MDNKTKLQEEIKKIEEEHMIFCGYRASECGCCSDIIQTKKQKLKEIKK